MSNKTEIKVSVCVVTYNQSKYIAKCLQSLIDQNTNFDYEIIVGDDCSKDSTRDVISKYYELYPGLIVPVFHEENIGPLENTLSVYKKARGRYICHMDGDDYALPGKLQKQFDALERNTDCVICTHDMKLVNAAGDDLGRSFRKHKGGVNTLMDLYENLPFFAHSSKMFINDLDLDFWNHLHPQALDIEVHVKQLYYGSIYHIPESLGGYRIFTGLSLDKKRVNPIIPNGAKRIFNEAISNEKEDIALLKKYYAKSLFNYAYQSAVLGNKEDLRKYILESINLSRISILQNVFFILSKLPWLVIFICKIRSRIVGYRNW